MGAGVTPPAPNGTSDGFSLVELLVVTAILAVLAVGVGLGVGRSGGPALRDAAFFEQSFARMRALAVHENAPVGLMIGPQAMQIVRSDGAAWRVSAMVRRWAGRVAFVEENRAATAEPDTPDIVFLPTGATSAFSISFSARGGGGTTRCETDGWAGLSCQGG